MGVLNNITAIGINLLCKLNKEALTRYPLTIDRTMYYNIKYIRL